MITNYTRNYALMHSMFWDAAVALSRPLAFNDVWNSGRHHLQLHQCEVSSESCRQPDTVQLSLMLAQMVTAKSQLWQ